MNKEIVKGFKDYVGEEAEKFSVIREMVRRTYEKYNFEEVQTPIIEREEFVKGDNSNDEAVSDIFKLQDKGKRKLALRYEFTFQLKRIANNKKLPFKIFQIGPVFRDEPVKGNRWRQFTQCDIDVIGSGVKEEAEVIAAAKEVLDALKIKSTIYFNNRKLLDEILESLGINNKDDKEQAIREIDKLDKLPEKEVKKNLDKIGAGELLSIVKKPEKFFERYKNYSEIKELKKYAGAYGVKLVFAPFLARGLAYYTGSIFEIKSELKETIVGGGSYMLNGFQSTGISMGLDRIVLISKMIVDIEKYLIVSLGEDRKAIELSKKLRSQGKNTSVYFGKPSKALEYANSYKIKNVIFVGAQEIKKKKFMVKDMDTGRQRVLVLEKRTKKNIILKKRR